MENNPTRGRSEEIAEILGHNLARHRLARGMTQDDVADGAGLHRTEIGMIERGERIPRADTLFQVIGALGIRANEAFEGVKWVLFDEKPGGFVEKVLPTDDQT